MKHEAEKFDREYYQSSIKVQKLEDEEEEYDLKNDFNVDVKEASTVLLIYVKNKTDKDLQVTLQIATKSKNMISPLSTIEETQGKS